MTLSVVLYGCNRSYELYMRLKEYDANVTDMADKGVFIYASGLTQGEYDEIIAICNQFGELA